MAELTKTDYGYVNNSGKKPLEYRYLDNCDSTVNEIRNDASFQRTDSLVWSQAEIQVGEDNEEFVNFKRKLFLTLPDFRSLCQEEFSLELAKHQNILLKEIERIRVGK